MNAPILEVTGLNAAYGQAQILFGLNLKVHAKNRRRHGTQRCWQIDHI